MPTYEYACTSCRRHFEFHQSFSDPPREVCEECGGTLKRVFHPVGIVLKGSGFYATDNRSGKKFSAPADPKSSDAKSTDAKPSESKAEKKTETKKSTDGGSTSGS